jgi:hypothetical protein
MLTVKIPAVEYYDPVNNAFVTIKQQHVQLEHSLVSLSKWEAKWNKPFLTKTPMSIEETMDYIRCMAITQNVDPIAYNALPKEELEKINAYIDHPMTATKFADDKSRPVKEVVTAEIIYYSMIALNIPFECQKWHLNRLLTLIKVCNLKQNPSKKMSQKEILARNRALNAQRQQMYNTKG